MLGRTLRPRAEVDYSAKSGPATTPGWLKKGTTKVTILVSSNLQVVARGVEVIARSYGNSYSLLSTIAQASLDSHDTHKENKEPVKGKSNLTFCIA